MVMLFNPFIERGSDLHLRRWLVGAAMVFLLSLAGLGVIWWRLAAPARLARAVGTDCFGLTNTQQQCWTDAMVRYVSQHPEDADQLFTGLYQLVHSGDLAVDARMFSEPAHQVGMTMVQQGVDFPQALVWCGNSFKGACRHGVTMEYADMYFTQREITVDNFVICNIVPVAKLDCMHGLGHSIIAHTSSLVLEDALAVCAELVDNSAESACASGVFMEYSTGEIGQGQHSHEPVYSIPLPCTQLITDSDFLAGVCYASVGSYRQYYPNQEPWSETLAYCADIEPTRFSTACYNTVIERLLLSVAYDQKEAQSLLTVIGGDLP